jgi:hypothetical protein
MVSSLRWCGQGTKSGNPKVTFCGEECATDSLEVKMRVVEALPPNIDQVDAAFGVRKILDRHPVYFSWGDKVFSPKGGTIPPPIMAHEAVHGARQARLDQDLDKAVRRWWDAYIADPAFRLDEEIPAHAAEYEWWRARAHTLRRIKGWRSPMDWHLQQIAARLSGPLYGRMISLSEAKRAIGG